MKPAYSLIRMNRTLSSPRSLLLGLAASAVVALLLVGAVGCGSTRADASESPSFDSDFWSHWGDGKAELAGYTLSYPRYGKIRQGTAVAIFVTETHSKKERIKNERPGRSESDLMPVMKLNLSQDFPTGIYDYNMMTSAFVALTELNGRPAGSESQISFSSQEWCGQLYSRLRFAKDSIAFESRSYFDGEGDEERSVKYPAEGISEDALLFWSRGWLGPRLAPGESVTRPLLRSLERARLDHKSVEWRQAEFRRAPSVESVQVPAGTFETDRFEVVIEGEGSWTFWVERTPSKRVVRWTRSDGLDAQLTGADRLVYWRLNGEGMESELSRLGLKPRGERMP